MCSNYHDLVYRYITEGDLAGELRGKIRGILSCDMTQQNPLYPSIFPQFDVITSGFCLETVPSTSAYREAAKNVAALLKPGGWMILAGLLSQSFYQFGQFKFPSLPLSTGDIQRIWSETGFTVEEWKQQEGNENLRCDIEALFYMICRKI